MKRILAFLLSIVLCFSLPFSASATEVNLPNLPSTNPDAGTYSFSRKYTNYYAYASFIEVMQDANYDIFNDTTVTVSFTGTEGPAEISVMIQYKEDGATSWTHGGEDILSLQESVTCSIPEDYTFRIVAVIISGNSGYATLQVSLA